jgi:hypothetical protein
MGGRGLGEVGSKGGASFSDWKLGRPWNGNLRMVPTYKYHKFYLWTTKGYAAEDGWLFVVIKLNITRPCFFAVE